MSNIKIGNIYSVNHKVAPSLIYGDIIALKVVGYRRTESGKNIYVLQRIGLVHNLHEEYSLSETVLRSIMARKWFIQANESEIAKILLIYDSK